MNKEIEEILQLEEVIKMAQNKPTKIRITIYPNQLQWIDFISKTFNRPRRQTLLECLACYIGEFKQNLKGEVIGNGN